MATATQVIKIGGSTLGEEDTLFDDLVALQRQGWRLVVVHGGGKTITDWLARLNIETRFVNGLRVTDEAGLEVVTAVLAGLVNKELVSQVNRRGGRAFGLSGADAGLVKATVRDEALGRVGEVVGVDVAPLEMLLAAGLLPIVAPVGLDTAAESPSALLNINADTVAGELAAALQAKRLVFLTDTPGVLAENGATIARLDARRIGELTAQGVISGGMLPKLEACQRAAAAGCCALIVDGRQPRALPRALAREAIGSYVFAATSKEPPT